MTDSNEKQEITEGIAEGVTEKAPASTPAVQSQLAPSQPAQPQLGLKSRTPDPATRPRKFMIVKIGQNPFGIQLSNVREVMGMGKLSPLPNMPNYFAGLINLRGKIISAIRLQDSLRGVQLEINELKPKRPCIVITEISGRLFGAIVDDVTEVVAVVPSEIDATTSHLASQDVFLGIIKISNKPLAPILNLERALRLNELISIESQGAA